MTRTSTLPSRWAGRASVCAWCRTRFGSIVELLDHVDLWHLDEEAPAARAGAQATATATTAAVRALRRTEY
jgi:hypothetical protein